MLKGGVLYTNWAASICAQRVLNQELPMNWFENILDFIYLLFKSLGPFIWGPLAIFYILLSVAVVVIFKPFMKVLGIPPKYKEYFHVVLFIAVFLALSIIIVISLSKHPMLDWMED